MQEYLPVPLTDEELIHRGTSLAAKIREREERESARVRMEELVAASRKPMYSEQDITAAMRKAYRIAGIKDETYR